ncbi:unnamed protein product [Phyllotreta striolata]|uniref:Cytochrome c oxidase assembly protein COX20, mitochondrial n=1 Tax=Phyllotreta striolata TaxID=444603 RepID=A0A9N9TXU6_PHYSR|nr:unnamed protein product [Phyllotreta striolata]
MTDEPKEKSLVIFGRDVGKIPCFRNSMFYGITGGLFSGLVRFMFTSHPQKSSNFAVLSFSFITLGYWVHCRYEYSKLKFETMRLQELLRRNTLLEGTQADVQIEEKFGTKPADA